MQYVRSYIEETLNTQVAGNILKLYKAGKIKHLKQRQNKFNCFDKVEKSDA